MWQKLLTCVLNTFFTRRLLLRFLAYILAKDIFLILHFPSSLQNGIESPSASWQEEGREDEGKPGEPSEER